MRILYYIYGLNIGGAETLIQNLLEKIDYENNQIEFVIQTKSINNLAIENIINKKKIVINYITSFYENPLKSYLDLKKLIKLGNYELIHIHVNSLINITPVILSARSGMGILIHSHSSSNAGGGMLGRIIHNINKVIISKYDTINLACSDDAGIWMFGKLKYDIIYNGIDINKYKYSNDFRREIRNKYGIGDDEIVIGHVGRFVQAKNHKFLLDCVSEYCKQNKSIKLLLVGKGQLEEDVKSQITKLNITNNVILAGETMDVYKYYSAFDIMVFPSIYEGLPFSLIEAQAAGLPIIASNVISTQVDITGLVTFLSLNESTKTWNESISRILKIHIDRMCYNTRMKNSAFDINNTVKRIGQIYETAAK